MQRVAVLGFCLRGTGWVLKQAQPTPNAAVSGSCSCLARNGPSLGVLLAPSPLAPGCLRTHTAAAAICWTHVIETLASQCSDGTGHKDRSPGHACPGEAYTHSVHLFFYQQTFTEAP